jgi:hypothetical protein
VNKKPLIEVSILVVVLLILGLLSNVVGYQSVKSTVVNDSPLFKTRTQSANNQEQNILTSQYLGKGNKWQFPIRDTRTEQQKKALEIISNMDDNTFHIFVEKIKTLISQKENTKDINFNDIEKVLYQFRKNSKAFPIGDNSESRTLFETPSICWFPGCILASILIILMCFYILIFIPTEYVQCILPSILICQ